MTSFADAYFTGDTTRPGVTRRRIIGAPLHLNEMPGDIPDELRERIIARLSRLPFNRYPEAYATSLVGKLAGWYNCRPEHIMVGPGSSAFIRLLLSYFGLHGKGKIIITRPTFAYYEQFCRLFGIPYDTWELDEDFSYTPDTLTNVPDYSVICLTTPNNPTGGVLDRADLISLLRRHPTSLFIVDEAYAAFVGDTMVPLVHTYDNLVVLQTFSKAWGAAALRCGVLIGSSSIVRPLSGLQTPWELTPFTIEAAQVVLEYIQSTNWLQDQVRAIITEREQLRRQCQELGTGMYTIFPSSANFMLIQAVDAKAHARLLAACEKYRVLVEDTSRRPRLAHCIRVTIGLPAENKLFLKAFQYAVARVPN